MALFTLPCKICATEFTQESKRGSLRRMCSPECKAVAAKRRKDKDKAKRLARYREVVAAGGSTRMAVWAMSGRIRTQVTLEVLKESK